MKTIEVKTGKEYEVKIGAGLLSEAGQHISRLFPERKGEPPEGEGRSERKTERPEGEGCPGRKAALVADSNVAALYAEAVKETLCSSGFSVSVFAFPAGEENKTGETLFGILGFLAEEKLTREDLVIALGGGVTGDMAGLAAALYMRGIEYVQIPTSILAAVDSSVGGKTAVDLPQGKNLAGAFHQPSLVLIDPEVFKTLPARDYCNGFAEVIKYGMIRDPQILAQVTSYEDPDEEGAAPQIPNEDMENLIARCVQIKAAVVEADEFERGERRLLNFGHTIGHAIEKASDYRLLHGEAVAIGMMMMTEAAVRAGLCDAAAPEKLGQALEVFNLPTGVGFKKGKDIPTGADPAEKIRIEKEDLMELISMDKKNTGDGIFLVIPEETGRCVIRKMNRKELAEFL